MDCFFDENYFERGIEYGISGYTNYRWIPELTIPLCFRIIEYLDIKTNQNILDFGASKGYLVKGFRLLHREAYGVDISKYAISKAPTEVRSYLKLIEPDDEIPNLGNKKCYDWIIAKDVLEHIPYLKIYDVLRRLRNAGQSVFVVVPLGNGKKYVIPAYEKDITHIIRESLNWWTNTFTNIGFYVEHASYHVDHIKDNWKQWEKGNGFFILRKN